MCRSIKTLFNYEPPASEAEIRAAAVQFVRKVSGSTRPSRANQTAFDHAVDEISGSVERLLSALVTNASPRDREAETERLRARTAQRFGAD